MKKLTCAKCGERKKLCESVSINGVKQPRLCKDCLLKSMKGDTEINDEFWVWQLVQAGEFKSLELLSTENG